MGLQEQILEILREPGSVPLVVESLGADTPGKEQSIRRAIRALIGEKKLFVIGTAKTGGRPMDVLCSTNYPGFKGGHELDVTKVTRAWNCEALRGHEVDAKLKPDATLLPSGVHIELDRATETWKQILAQLGRYKGREEIVIFLTTTETRVKGVLGRAKFLRGWLLAGTIAEAQRGLEAKLKTVDGNEITVKKTITKVLKLKHGTSPQPEQEPGINEAGGTPAGTPCGVSPIPFFHGEKPMEKQVKQQERKQILEGYSNPQDYQVPATQNGQATPAQAQIPTAGIPQMMQMPESMLFGNLLGNLASQRMQFPLMTTMDFNLFMGEWSTRGSITETITAESDM